jgi:hypothetical protein
VFELPFCPKCGVEIEEFKDFCPACGHDLSNFGFRMGARSPLRQGVFNYLKHAIDVARGRPIVFVPSIIMGILGSLRTQILFRFLRDSGIMDELYGRLGVYYAFTPVKYVSVTGPQVNYSIPSYTGGVVMLFTVFMFFNFLTKIASLHLSREAYNNSSTQLSSSYTYALQRLGAFIVMALTGIVASFLLMSPIIVGVIMMESISISAYFVIFLISFTLFMIFMFVYETAYFLMVVDDTEMREAFSDAFQLIRSRLSSLLGLGIIAVIVSVALSLIPYVGGVLTMAVDVVYNIAVIDLYHQYLKATK